MPLSESKHHEAKEVAVNNIMTKQIFSKDDAKNPDAMGMGERLQKERKS